MEKQTNPQESRLSSLKRHYLAILGHACHCTDENCMELGCQKMKSVVQHAKSCKQSSKEECYCKLLKDLCLYHAKHCQEDKCPVLFCVNIKKRLSNSVLQACPGNSNSSNQTSPGASQNSPPYPPQPGVVKPSTEPSVGALQAVKVQAVARQTAPRIVLPVKYGIDNPVSRPDETMNMLATNQQKQTHMPKTMSRAISLAPNRMINMNNVANCENSGYPQPQQTEKPQSIFQQGLAQPSQFMGGSNNTLNSIGNTTMEPPGPPFGALQAVKVQAVARQTAPLMNSINYNKDNPVSRPAETTNMLATNQQIQTHMQKPMPQLVSSNPNRMINMNNVANRENSGFPQNPQPQQTEKSLSIPQLGLAQPSQFMGGSNNMSNSIGNRTMGPLGPPFGTLQAVQQVQAVARQTAPRMVSPVNYGKGNPVSPPAATTNITTNIIATNQQIETHIQKPLSQLVSSSPNRMINMNTVASCKNSGLSQNPQPQQNAQPIPKLVLGRPQFMEGSNNMPNSIENSTMGPPPQVMDNPEPSLESMERATPAWQQLLQTVKSPSAQQQEVLAIFKSNPQLLAAFIKPRTLQQQKRVLVNDGSMTVPPKSECYKQQQHLLALKTQQQQPQPSQFPLPQPTMYPQRPRMTMPKSFWHEQGFQGDNSQFQQSLQMLIAQINQILLFILLLIFLQLVLLMFQLILLLVLNEQS